VKLKRGELLALKDRSDFVLDERSEKNSIGP